MKLGQLSCALAANTAMSAQMHTLFVSFVWSLQHPPGQRRKDRKLRECSNTLKGGKSSPLEANSKGSPRSG